MSFHKVKVTDVTEPNITKREVLGQSSRVCDPLGMLSPVTIRSKMLMQCLWKDKYRWDEPLPLSIQQEWTTLAKDLELAMETEMSRQYFDELNKRK